MLCGSPGIGFASPCTSNTRSPPSPRGFSSPDSSELRPSGSSTPLSTTMPFFFCRTRITLHTASHTLLGDSEYQRMLLQHLNLSLKRLTIPVNGGKWNITACRLRSKKNSPQKFLRRTNHSESSKFASKYLKSCVSILCLFIVASLNTSREVHCRGHLLNIILGKR